MNESACYNPECPDHRIQIPEHSSHFNMDRRLVWDITDQVQIKRHLYSFRQGQSIYYCDSCHGAIQSVLMKRLK